MSFNEANIREITENVWSTMLGMPLEARWGSVPPGPPQLHVASWVHISGVWSGAITIACSSLAARRAAGAMFGMSPEEASVEEVKDAMGEVANIIGGNLKGLLHGPATLSLPSVIEIIDIAALPQEVGTEPVARFESEGEPLVVKIITGTCPPLSR